MTYRSPEVSTVRVWSSPSLCSWPRPLLRVTENLVVALRATSANTAAAVYQFNAATLQICREWVREQRLEGIERDRVTPDRPREPILAILAMETGRIEA